MDVLSDIFSDVLSDILDLAGARQRREKGTSKRFQRKFSGENPLPCPVPNCTTVKFWNYIEKCSEKESLVIPKDDEGNVAWDDTDRWTTMSLNIDCETRNNFLRCIRSHFILEIQNGDEGHKTHLPGLLRDYATESKAKDALTLRALLSNEVDEAESEESVSEEV